MDELLSVKQVAEEFGLSAQEVVDIIRAGHMAPHCASGRVLFAHPERMAICKMEEIYITRSEFSKYLSKRVFKPLDERVVSRRKLLAEIGKLGAKPAKERRRLARMALAVYEGAAYDEPADRYFAGARDVLRELCLREGVWLHADR